MGKIKQNHFASLFHAIEPKSLLALFISAVFRAAMKLREGNVIQFLKSNSLLSAFNGKQRRKKNKKYNRIIIMIDLNKSGKSYRYTNKSMHRLIVCHYIQTLMRLKCHVQRIQSTSCKYIVNALFLLRLLKFFAFNEVAKTMRKNTHTHKEKPFSIGNKMVYLFRIGRIV